jgi:hypothetical protein
MKELAFSHDLNFFEIVSQQKINEQVDSSFDNGTSTFDHAQNCPSKFLTFENDPSDFRLGTFGKLHQKDPQKNLNGF